jgi:hypothetical protein
MGMVCFLVSPLDPKDHRLQSLWMSTTCRVYVDVSSLELVYNDLHTANIKVYLAPTCGT